VTPEDELKEAQHKKGIEAAWAGGKDGIQVLLNFLPQVYNLLSNKGAFYLLLIEDNLSIMEKLSEMFDIVVLIKREVIGEKQLVVRLTKKLN
jgi:release factor glutamine methyltransferase